MSKTRTYIGDLFVSNRWYAVLTAFVVLFFVSFFVPLLYRLVFTGTAIVLFFTLVDYILLFLVKGNITGHRIMAPRFSIGEENNIDITLVNSYPFKVHGYIIDELPAQFQVRDFHMDIHVAMQSRSKISYKLRPLSRGVYGFGSLICYMSSPLGLLQRRVILAPDQEIKVYPAFHELRRYQLQLQATSANTVTGFKKVRRLGHSLEFEKIKDYVPGDDVRTINWKATARSNNLMVNTYTDARQQQVYCLIDKGRNMKMPFEGMTLLDYSINAALALLNVTLLKQDKAGVITFSNKVNDIVAADRRNNQLHTILETLYKQQTDFRESDYEAVWVAIHKRITQRSLVVFFTNFETYSSLERQLPFLKKIAQHHLVCVVFFQNTLLEEIHGSMPDDIEGIYIKTIADQFAFEKRQIVKVLRQHGILSILTTPENLNIDVINKYLEMKARQML